MKVSPIVGKNIIETLTVGMYTDPKIVFREYIQNATDSLDLAQQTGLLKKGEAPSIDVKVVGRNISVEDNGTGIEATQAISKLCDIGKSEKNFMEQRGFRGIGRLGGLAYCNRLVFSTSASGSDQFVEVSFDCNKLKRLLSPALAKNMTAVELITDVVSVKQGKEKVRGHYFKVVLEHVTEPELLDERRVYDYLCMVSPVKYHSTKFIFARKIYDLFEKHNVPYESYEIKLNGKYVLKPYSGHFRIHGDKKDYVRDLKEFEHITADGRNSFFGWYADCHMLGSIVDDLQKGMRVRKGNILIGDETFSRLFLSKSNVRFYSWVAGEVFVFDNSLIPNARRDSFESSKSFDAFQREMKGLFSQITKEIREKSKQRKDASTKKAVQVESIISEVEKDLKNGFKSKRELEKAKEDVEVAKDLIDEITAHLASVKDKDEKKAKEGMVAELREGLDAAARSLEHRAFFKADKLTTRLSKKERKIVIEIFDQIYEELEDDAANRLIDAIIGRLNRKGKMK